MAKNEKRLEDSFEELDSIINQLEDSDTSLDDSFKLYNQGVQLLKACNESIDKIEKKIILLNENGESDEF